MFFTRICLLIVIADVLMRFVEQLWPAVFIAWQQMFLYIILVIMWCLFCVVCVFLENTLCVDVHMRILCVLMSICIR